MMSAAFFTIFLLYPTNSQKIFTTFLCKTFDDPAQTRALIVDYSVNCALPEHQLMEIYAMLMFIYPIGIPTFFFVLLLMLSLLLHPLLVLLLLLYHLQQFLVVQ